MRIACLLVPDLPLAAEIRARPDLAGHPVAVVSGPGPRAEVVALSPEAAQRGVRRRASVAYARATCADLCVRVASPALERAARAALLDAALSLSPRAELAPRLSGAYAGEGAVFLDAAGVGALHRTEESFAAALAERARRVGLPGWVAVASTRGVARIAARRGAAGARAEGETRILSPGAETAFLAPLPIDVLDAGDALGETLTHLGIRRVGDLLSLPRRALATRFGREILRLVAVARGEESEPPLPCPNDPSLAEAIDLEFPIDRLEPLAFVLQGLLSRLLARLEARHLACGDLALTLELAGGGRDARHIGVAAPTLDRRVLLRLACLALETHPPDAPALGLSLETRGRPVSSDQLDLFLPAGPAPAALEETLAELESLCGAGRVGAPRVADDHRPDAFAVTPFEVGRRRAGDPPRAGGLAGSGSPSGETSLALRALRPPVRAEVRVVHGLPARIRSAVANGDVVRVAGPWRTTGAWWSPEGRFAYDSFDVQTSDGNVVRLRRDHVRRTWHIDAVYD